jgi:hypothetical protein
MQKRWRFKGLYRCVRACFSLFLLCLIFGFTFSAAEAGRCWGPAARVGAVGGGVAAWVTDPLFLLHQQTRPPPPPPPLRKTIIPRFLCRRFLLLLLKSQQRRRFERDAAQLFAFPSSCSLLLARSERGIFIFIPIHPRSFKARQKSSFFLRKLLYSTVTSERKSELSSK